MMSHDIVIKGNRRQNSHIWSNLACFLVFALLTVPIRMIAFDVVTIYPCFVTGYLFCFFEQFWHHSTTPEWYLSDIDMSRLIVIWFPNSDLTIFRNEVFYIYGRGWNFWALIVINIFPALWKTLVRFIKTFLRQNIFAILYHHILFVP